MDPIEHRILMMKRQAENKNEAGDKSPRKYDNISMWRKEVDFHHKVFYRFEKAYRLTKK